MPRCGQMSRSAHTAPVSARPRIIGSPRKVFAVIWPRFSALPRNAQNQASRSGAAASDSMAPVGLPEEAMRPELTLARAASEGNGASFDSGPSGLAQDEGDRVKPLNAPHPEPPRLGGESKDARIPFRPDLL